MKRYDAVTLQTLANDLEMELTKLAKLERVMAKKQTLCISAKPALDLAMADNNKEE